MQVEGCPVLCKTHHAIHHAQVGFTTSWVANTIEHGTLIDWFGHIHRTHSGAHKSGVNRQEEIAISPGRQKIVKDDTNRTVLVCLDNRTKIVGLTNSDRL